MAGRSVLWIFVNNVCFQLLSLYIVVEESCNSRSSPYVSPSVCSLRYFHEYHVYTETLSESYPCGFYPLSTDSNSFAECMSTGLLPKDTTLQRGPSQISSFAFNCFFPNIMIRGGEDSEDVSSPGAWSKREPLAKRRSGAEDAVQTSDSDSAAASEVSEAAAPRFVRREGENPALIRFKVTGDKLYGMADYAGAVTAYTAALRLDPRHAAVRANRAAALTMQRRYGEAAADGVAAAAADPSLLAAALSAGRAMLALGMADEARRHLTRVRAAAAPPGMARGDAHVQQLLEGAAEVRRAPPPPPGLPTRRHAGAPRVSGPH
jgi:hypothetical protein